MKKFTSFLLAMLLAFSLFAFSGCGNNDNTVDPDDQNTVEEENNTDNTDNTDNGDAGTNADEDVKGATDWGDDATNNDYNNNDKNNVTDNYNKNGTMNNKNLK